MLLRYRQPDQTGTGAYLMPASPLEFSGVPRLPVRRAPMLGENTDEVLAEVLRMSSSEIARLHDQRVFRQRARFRALTTVAAHLPNSLSRGRGLPAAASWERPAAICEQIAAG
jgi:hypothetical protein